MNTREPWSIEHTELVSILRSATFDPPLPAAIDRDAWTARAASRCGHDILDGVDELVDAPIPPSRATEFLEFWRSGDRAGFEVNYNLRRKNLARLAIAFFATQDRRYVDPIMDYFWAICEETTWIMSAHLRNNGYASELPSARVHQIDLGAAQTALFVAEMSFQLRDVLHPDIIRRVREELEIRIFEPYRYRNNFHWEVAEHNWNGVCTSGVLGAAIYAETDVVELAHVLLKGFRGLSNYLRGFDEDGGVSEGLMPWSFGFAHYCILSDLIERRTDRKVSLIEDVPLTRAIADFPVKLHLSGTKYVSFSDADESFAVPPVINSYLVERHGMVLPIVPYRGSTSINFTVRLYLMDDRASVAEYPTRSRTDFFRGLTWMVARLDPDDPQTLVVAAKGGHNGEHHNHNDCGAFMVHYRGENLIAELGRDTFTRQMFDSGRYAILANRSEGHSVPVVNGQFQGKGRAYAASLIEQVSDDSHDLARYDLAGAYPNGSGIARLVRSVELDRSGSGSVKLSDHLELSEPGEVIEVFWTFCEPRQQAGAIVVRGEHGALRIDAAVNRVAVTPGFERIERAVRSTDAYRILVPISGAREAVFTAVFTPID